MIKLFLWIFNYFIEFLEIFLTCFSDPKIWLPGPGGRSGRSTVIQSRSTDVHRSVHVWPGTGPVDRAVDQPESFALCKFAIDRAAPTVIFMTVGGRPAVDRQPVRLPDQPNG